MTQKKTEEAPQAAMMRYPACKADKDLEYYIKARYNLIYVVTWEEQRVIDSLQEIADLPELDLSGVQKWDAARGLCHSRGKNIKIDGGEDIKTPEMMLDHIAKHAEEMKGQVTTAKAQKGPIYVLCDMFRFLDADGITPEVERKLRVLSTLLKRSSITVVMTSPILALPTALEKCVAVLDYPLPGAEQLNVMLKNAKPRLLERKKITEESLVATPDEKVVRSLMGLTMQEAEDAVAKAVVIKKSFDIPTLLDIKRQIIRKGELLDYVYSEEGLDEVGGFQGVKEFIKLRKRGFTDRAVAYGLPASKGIFLAGIQGTGKSLIAKAIANEFQVPLLRLDMGRMFGGLMGESENNMRRAIQLAESVAPCVLLVDELAESLAGGQGSATTDSGTTKRVIANFLNWMQEKVAPVFIVATSNSLNLPASVLRKGRFDELFFVDLPTDEEKKEIFCIHLRKVKRDPTKFDLVELAKRAEKFIGSEIEAAIVDAMFNAFADNEREVTTEDVLSSIQTITPLAITMKEELDRIKEEMRGRMRPASFPLSRKIVADDKAGDGSRFDSL